MVFGGIMEVTGLLGRLSNPIVNEAETNGNLVIQQQACVSFLMLQTDQYLSIVVPGRMFGKLIKRKGLSRKT